MRTPMLGNYDVVLVATSCHQGKHDGLVIMFQLIASISQPCTKRGPMSALGGDSDDPPPQTESHDPLPKAFLRESPAKPPQNSGRLSKNSPDLIPPFFSKNVFFFSSILMPLFSVFSQAQRKFCLKTVS
ncbi:hypothetical protein VNO77_03550 [Canavalia gladiata]|uniref:Uncharacterized protein n=1 Tax=Canavalia gladiata TaxID=3824 RepID=A0AAN9MVI7_CANGL